MSDKRYKRLDPSNDTERAMYKEGFDVYEDTEGFVVCGMCVIGIATDRSCTRTLESITGINDGTLQCHSGIHYRVREAYFE